MKLAAIIEPPFYWNTALLFCLAMESLVCLFPKDSHYWIA